MTTFNQTISDSGVVQTDEIYRLFVITISDTGVSSNTSSITRFIYRFITENIYTDDAFVLKATRLIASTGLVLTDSVRADIGVVRYTTNQFANLESTRNWSIVFTGEDGWYYSSDRNYEIEVVT